MPSELRFCRNCGFRLGEGPAEYTETVRFSNAPGLGSFAQVPSVAASQLPARKRRRLSGMTWMFLGLLLFFIAAVAFTSIVSPLRRVVQVEVGRMASRSYVGVDGFDSVEGGVSFGNVEPPGSPADLAGLVGGDIITSFDGKPVTDEDEISEFLRDTPVGKTVEVVFIRDGETKTTKLTTVGKEEFDRLIGEFRKRPEGRGRFGYDDGEVVPIPGTKTAGVKLNEVSPSLPADMAGIKEGDIIVEFGGVPIRTDDELRSRIQRALPYSTVKIVVMRGSERLEIPVKIGRQT